MTQNVNNLQPPEHELLTGLVNQLVSALQSPSGPKPRNAEGMLRSAFRAQEWLRRHPPTAPLAPRPCRDPDCRTVFQPINPRSLYHTEKCRYRHNKARARSTLRKAS